VNTYHFSAATMVARTRLNVTLYVHCLPCVGNMKAVLHVAGYISCQCSEQWTYPHRKRYWNTQPVIIFL